MCSLTVVASVDLMADSCFASKPHRVASTLKVAVTVFVHKRLCELLVGIATKLTVVEYNLRACVTQRIGITEDPSVNRALVLGCR